MSTQRTLSLLVCLGLTVVPEALLAQTATGVAGVSVPTAHGPAVFRHHKELVATYDSLTDSTHLAVVTHKGKYFLWIQHPRLMWTITYPGRTPGVQAPEEIVLVFRTQNPQAPADNRLVIESATGERVEVTSVGASNAPGPMTSSHFMRFPIPTVQLAKALAGDGMGLSVGGIRVKFKPDQLEALRDLLSQVGAWPLTSVSGGA